MSILSNLELIRRVPLFSMLTAAQAETIAANVMKKRFAKGSTIVEDGKKSNALFIILTGKAKVVAADSTGKEAILAHLKPGDYIGEMSLIDDQPHSASVKAEVITDVLVLGRQQFSQTLPENAAMSFAIMKVLVKRLRQADRKIESLALMDVYSRVVMTLREMGETTDDGDTIITGKFSRQAIAQTVGASREMVGRVMKNLEDEGILLVTSDGKTCLKKSQCGIN
jgi:CRP/FNR family transcriptional regulator, cyclic AMP receptor protein